MAALILSAVLFLAAADSDPVEAALAKLMPDWPASRRTLVAANITHYSVAQKLDPVLVAVVAAKEDQRGQPAEGRVALNKQEAVFNQVPANSFRVPSVWDDPLNLTQALSDAMTEYAARKKKGRKLALQAYFYGMQSPQDSSAAGFADGEFLAGVLKTYDELTAPPPDTTSSGPASATLSSEPDPRQLDPNFDVDTDIYARWIRFYNPRISTEKSLAMAQHLVFYCALQDLNAQLVFSVLAAESNFDSTAVSNKGAQGLGQLMPATAGSQGVKNPFDIKDNIRATVIILKDLTSRYELPIALAAYNAGEGAVKKYDGIPPYDETRKYVNRVIRIYNRMQGKSSESRNS